MFLPNAGRVGVLLSGIKMYTATSVSNPNGRRAWMDPSPAPPQKPKAKAAGGTATQSSSEAPAECPLCAMVKAGPCRDSFFPFEACLDRCEASGEDPSLACREPFANMMKCITQHPKEYAKFLGVNDDESSDDSPQKEN